MFTSTDTPRRTCHRHFRKSERVMQSVWLVTALQRNWNVFFPSQRNRFSNRSRIAFFSLSCNLITVEGGGGKAIRPSNSKSAYTAVKKSDLNLASWISLLWFVRPTTIAVPLADLNQFKWSPEAEQWAGVFLVFFLLLGGGQKAAGTFNYIGPTCQ